jgi:Tol biopolymer transport system component
MVIPAAGGQARLLWRIDKPEDFPFGSFAWTSDSTQVVAVRTQNATLEQRDQVSELWLVPLNGSPRKRVDFPAIRIAQLRMNPDGRKIAFTSGEAAGEVWVAENILPK